MNDDPAAPASSDDGASGRTSVRYTDVVALNLVVDAILDLAWRLTQDHMLAFAADVLETLKPLRR